MTERLARASSRHPWRVIAAWLFAVVVSVFAVGLFLEDALTADVEITSATESNRAQRLLSEGFAPTVGELERDVTEVVVVRTEAGSIEDAAARERVAALGAELRSAGATNVVTYA